MSATIDNEEKQETLPAEVRTVIDKLPLGKVSYKDALAVVAQPPEKLPVPEKLPAPAVITDEQRAALQRLVEVFGGVVPTERRDLTIPEVTQLLVETRTLKAVEKLTKDRISDIRTTMFNHFDVVAEKAKLVDDDTPRTEEGHYPLAGEAKGDAQPTKFTREVRQGSVDVSESMLRELAEDESYPDFTHTDYLAVTVPVRMFNEHKFMLALKKKPKLLVAIQKAVTKGRPVASFHSERKS